MVSSTSLVYRQSRADLKTSKWLFVAASPTMQDLVNAYIQSQSGVSGDPFSLHLLTVNAAAATWRRYLIYLAEEVRKQVRSTTPVLCCREGAKRGIRQIEQFWPVLKEKECTLPSSRKVNT